MKKKIQSRDKAQWSEIRFDKFLFYCTCVFKRYFNYLAKGSVQCPLKTKENISGEALSVLSSHKVCFYSTSF